MGLINNSNDEEIFIIDNNGVYLRDKSTADNHFGMIFIEKYYIAYHWKKYGGSFTKALAEALLLADKNNTRKILSTWQEYFSGDLEIILKAQEEQKEF